MALESIGTYSSAMYEIFWVYKMAYIVASFLESNEVLKKYFVV